jgi:ubiquinone/menaquinone biosynthesis C-methylase UbiE
MERPEYESMYALEDNHWWFVGRRRLAFSLIDQWLTLTPNANILDVGCGTGGNAAALAKYGRPTGLDLSPIALDFARRRQLCRLSQGSGLALPYASNTFELVTIFDVLYHRWITDDEQAIQELYRVLQPGGWLLITDSALPMLWSSHDEVYFARQRYTLKELRYKLTKIGLELHVCSYANMLLLPIFLFVRLAMDWLPLANNIDRQGTFPAWLNNILTAIRGLESVWLRWGGTLPVGSSLVCLSRKPKST